MNLIRTTSLTGKNSSESMPDSGYLLRRILTLMLLFAAVTVPCLVLYHAAYPSHEFISRSSQNLVDSSSSSAINDSSTFFVRKETRLARAEIDDYYWPLDDFEKRSFYIRIIQRLLIVSIKARGFPKRSQIFFMELEFGNERLFSAFQLFSFDSEEHRLEKVLKEAAMEDKTVILTTINEAWATPDSIFDLFLQSFLVGDQTRKLLNHLVIIALDQKAYARCLEVHSHCFALTTGVDFSEEAYFMAPDYLKMMWRRIDFLRSVLEMGYNFIFSDADIMWFRDPFRRFYRDADFQIACDNFLGNSYDLHNRPNGGFNYVKSNNRTIQFYKYWYSSRETHPGKHDQDVLNMIKYDPFIKGIGLKIRFLNTAYFGGLCEPSRNLNEVCTMHVNCCFGLDSKLNDMKVMLQDWRNFMALPPTVKKSGQSSWHVPQNCSLSSYRRPVAKSNVHPARKD